MKPRILVVDDEPEAVELVEFNLKQAGYAVTTAIDGAEALKKARHQTPDLIVLDVMLPEMDGFEICKTLRLDAATARVPIIMLTAKAAEIDRVLGLELGADDYVTKPFRMKELQARVRAALRRSMERGKAPKVFYSRGLEIDFEQRTVKLSGEPMHLTRKEYDLLVCLAHHAGQVVTHKQLLAAGWGGTQVDTQFVRAAIGQLRQKVEANPGAPVRILTEQGVGYRLKVDS